MGDMINFETNPSQYRHWRVEYDGAVARVHMDVDENGGLFDGYELKLNSYDLGVDIELADIVQRMRFEHPEVSVVVLQSAKDKVFCAGANIRMLAGAAHAHKVNFCKFTNETRNAMEMAEADSGQKYVAAIKGACAGGGHHVDNCFRGWNDSWLHPDFREWNVSDCLDYIRVPVLAIQGHDDQYGSMAQINEVTDRCYAPVDLLTLTDCRHAPYLDQPQATLDGVSDFCRRLADING